MDWRQAASARKALRNREALVIAAKMQPVDTIVDRLHAAAQRVAKHGQSAGAAWVRLAGLRRHCA